MRLNSFILINLTAVLLLFSALSAFSEGVQTASQKSSSSQINYSDHSPVGVYKVSPEAKDALLNLKVVVRHGRIDGCYVAELTLSQAGQLSNLGFRLEKIFDNLEEEDAFLRAQPGFDEIHTYSQIRDGLLLLEATYPEIADFQLFGYSVQNRELFGLRISDNADIEEDEPEVVFWGNIHGNEYTSAEIPYMYAAYLCRRYGENPTITQYVNDNEIWCIPMINPDGRVNGTRNNANNIDLNRDLGYQWEGWGGSPAPLSQPETQIIHQFCVANSPVISNSYHNSGDEMYHPWGYMPTNPPDLGVMVRVGERYADAASYAFFSSFNSYPTHGEILDFAYGCFGGLSYTLEISSSSTGVMQTFQRNLPGMNFFCSIAGEGIHGLVTDAQTGEPLHAAVWIQGNPFPAYTDPEIGDFHRLLLPGAYDLTVWTNGYQPQNVENVVVSFGNPGEFEVELQPADGEYAFMVVSVQQKDPNNAYNNQTFPSQALAAPDTVPCSLGANGFIVLDMGLNHEIVNGPGADFTVVEAIFEQDPNPENFRVYAGNAYVQSVMIGTGTGTTSFDLDGTGIDTVRYLKISDNSGASPNLPYAGMDLDAVVVINGSDFLASNPILPNSEFRIPLSTYPNPFNQSTAISYKLQAASYMELKVYDITGREVAQLVKGYKNAGSHEVVFDAKDLASGVYLVRLEAGGFRCIRKLMLLK